MRLHRPAEYRRRTTAGDQFHFNVLKLNPLSIVGLTMRKGDTS